MAGTITNIFYLGSPSNMIPPGVSIDIIGVGFGSGPPAGATITFTEVGGSGTILTVTAASTGAAGQITGWVGNDITVTLPAAVNFTELGLHTWSIQVSSTVIGSSNVWAGTYFIPTITGITPNPVQTGQTITISGTFNPTQLTMLLAWDTAANVITPLTWNATTITAVVPTNIPASFAGISHEFGIYNPGHFPLVPPFVETQFAILVQGGPQITSVAPGQCAPGQTCEVQGNGFGASQGATILQLNGSNVTPTTWSNSLITFVVPLATPIGSGTVTVAHSPFPTATGFFNVTAAMVLPGATVGVQGQPVNLTGSGFGAVAGTLIYFSTNGLLVNLLITDWSATSIFTNIPAEADLGPGTIWVVLNGQTGESDIFSGFTIGLGFAGPQVTAFIPNVTWVSSTNVSYPLVEYFQGSLKKFEAFPRGKIIKVTGDPSYDVDWLTQILPFPTYSKVSAPSTDLAAIGNLTTASINALGLIPPPPNLASNTSLVLIPTSGMGGTVADVTVTGAAPTPVGTVNLILDGLTQINTGSLVSGSISFSVPESTWVTVGPHTLTADYLGDAKHVGSSNTQTFTFTAPPHLVVPFVVDFWTTGAGPLFIKDDGTQTAGQTADVNNSSATVGIACTITNGSPLVPTNGDLTPWFSNGTQIIFSADVSSTVYTVMSITSSQITLTGNYTGASSSSFGSNVAYNLVEPTGTFQFKIDGSNFGTPVGLTGSPPNANSITATGGVAPLSPAGFYTAGGTYSGDSVYDPASPNGPVPALQLGVYTSIPSMAISTALFGTFHVTNGLGTVTTSIDLTSVLGQGGQQLTFASDPLNHYTVTVGSVTSGGFSLTTTYTGTTATATTASLFTVTIDDFQTFVLTATCSCSLSGGPTPTGYVQFAYFTGGGWQTFSSLLDGGNSDFALVHLSNLVATTFDFTGIITPGMVIWFLDDDPSNYYLVTAVSPTQVTIGSFNGGPSTYQGASDPATDAQIIALAVLTPSGPSTAVAQAVMPAGDPFTAGSYHFSFQYFTADAHYNSSAFPAGGPPATAPNADTTFTFQGITALLPFVTDSWNVLRVRDDGGAAHQTATVTNSSSTVGIGVTVTNGMPTVPTQFDLTPWFSNGQVISFAMQPNVYYTIMTITSSTITLTANYTGTSSSSFGTSAAYRAMVNPIGDWQFTVNAVNFGPLQFIEEGSTVSDTAFGGTAPLTPDGNYSPGGTFTSGSPRWQTSGPNGPFALANLLVYSPTPSTSLSTLLLGTFSSSDGNTITATVNQSTALGTGGSDVAFSGQPASNYQVSSAPAPSTTFMLNSTYTGTLPFSGETASVTVVQVGSGQFIPLLGNTGCDEAPFGPTPTGTLTMWWWNGASWISLGTGSLVANINTFSRAQVVIPVGSPNPLDPPTGTPQNFTFSFTTGDGNYNSIPAPGPGGPPLSAPYANFTFSFSGGS